MKIHIIKILKLIENQLYNEFIQIYYNEKDYQIIIN